MKSHLDTSELRRMPEQYARAFENMSPVITEILVRYKDWGTMIDVEESEFPHFEIQDFLANIDIYYPGANYEKLKLAIREKLKNLTCFRFRVIAKTNEKQIYWNPIEENFRKFKSLHTNSRLEYRLTNEPYPAIDIINEWIISLGRS